MADERFPSAPLRHVFGPLRSRRLGRSLGVSLVPRKTCPLDCVYCECGDTTSLTLERRPYVPLAEVKEQLAEAMAASPAFDFITFSGAGEPTLHTEIGALCAWIKERWPSSRLCLLTNGVFLGDEALARELLPLDLVVPSLDAADEDAFRAVNRPARGLSAAALVAGLARFREINRVPFWLEVFVVPGVNDSPGSVRALADAARLIRPDKIQLNSLDRPGCVPWLRVPTDAEFALFESAFSGVCPVERIAPPTAPPA